MDELYGLIRIEVKYYFLTKYNHTMSNIYVIYWCILFVTFMLKNKPTLSFDVYISELHNRICYLKKKSHKVPCTCSFSNYN